MTRITTDELLEMIFVDDDGEVLDPETTPYVLMPHPGARPTSRRANFALPEGTNPATTRSISRCPVSTKPERPATL